MSPTSRRRRSLLALTLAAWLGTNGLAHRPAGAEEANPDPAATAAPATSPNAAPEPASAPEDAARWRRATEAQREDAELAMKRVVDRRRGKVLVKAREYLLAQNYDEAEKVLTRLNPKRLNSYERALLRRIEGYIAYGREDYDAAVEKLKLALAEQIFTRSDSADIQFQIAQIRMAQQKWPDAVEALQTWFASVEDPGAAGYFHLALCYYQMKDLDSALEPARKAVELADHPQQGWLQLLLAIELTKQDYPAATPILVDLLTHFPGVGKSYWIQLSTLYGVQEHVDRALAVLELAHRLGLLTEDKELLRLAQLSQSQDLPLRAARLLEAGLADKQIAPDVQAYELLGNSWILARESAKGAPALAQAAALAPQGDLYVRLGQVLLLNGQWDEATAALRAAIEKGGLRDPSSVQILLGIAYYNDARLSEARTWFARARQSDKTRAPADAWLEHIDRELQTQRAKATSLG